MVSFSSNAAVPALVLAQGLAPLPTQEEKLHAMLATPLAAVLAAGPLQEMIVFLPFPLRARFQ
jgi:hypothetical protein